jgi:hypothetical protein
MDKTDYEVVGAKIGRLVNEKQAAYGDSFGKAHRILLELYPDGIKPEAYHDVLTMARIIDKLFRIATKKDAFGESPYQDIAGYAILATGKHEREQKEEMLVSILSPHDCRKKPLDKFVTFEEPSDPQAPTYGYFSTKDTK